MNHNQFPPQRSEFQETPDTSSQSETTPKIESLPTTSPNPTCCFYLREIDRLDRLAAIKDFLNDITDRDFHEFKDPIDLDAFGAAYSEFISSALTPEDKTALKNYSGFGYRIINQVARGQWNYDLLGPQTTEQVAQAEHDINQISSAIARVPSPGVNLISHRGTNLDSFRAYGVNSLSELSKLEGQFFLEEGFTSTALSPDKSFADKDFDDPLRRACNIQITYRIPEEAQETIALLTPELAYNPEQSELLIDKGSLFYISSAEVSPNKSSAALEMTLIPRNLYDPAYQSFDG